MKTTYKIYLRKSFTKNDGSHPIYLRITINRLSKTYSLDVSCHLSYWNESKKEVKPNYPNQEKINLVIINARNRAEKIIFDYVLNNKSLTFVDFEREYFAPVFKNNSFYEYIEYSIKETTGILAKETIKTHKTQLSKLMKFRPQLSFGEVSNHFLDGYKKYMLKELGNNLNTCNKSLVFIKVMLNRSVSDGAIKINPIREYKIKRVKGNREFLTLDELTTMEKLLRENIPNRLRNVLEYFLFACYTGLRYRDIKNLRYSNIENNMITLTMHKTKERVTIPIISKAKVFLKEGFPEQRIFRVLTNQVTNRYIKQLVNKTLIKKGISFHCARHTFATVGIELGIPIEYISSLLGHKDLKTTQIYAKILDYKKVEVMKKWEQNSNLS